MAISEFFPTVRILPQDRQASSPLPALLEFQSPTAAVIAQPLPLSGRTTIWTVAAMVLSGIAIMAVCSVDRVVAVPGQVVAETPNIVVQPLDTSIVRSINVHEGQTVHAGDLLARLDPTFAAADAGSSEAQVVSLQAEVDRLEAESRGNGYLPDGSPASELQAAIFAQRHAEQAAKLENYRQRIDSARAKVLQTTTDIAAYAEQYKAALDKESVRRELERLHVGSKLNLLDAGAARAETGRSLQAANAANASARSDLDALIAERDAYIQQTQAEFSQQLAEQGRKLSDASEQRNKVNLRHQLVDLRAERDAVVLTVAKVSPGSVLQSGDELITLVPKDASLQVEANIVGRDSGFVRDGNPAVIKFDTFPYTTYGYAKGTVQAVSADSFASPRFVRERPARPGASPADAAKDGIFYRATVSLDEVRLHNLPGALHVTQGMPVTVDIKVGQHTILAYLMSRAIPVFSEGLREP
jgi:HlyD family secretion protein